MIACLATFGIFSSDGDAQTATPAAERGTRDREFPIARAGELHIRSFGHVLRSAVDSVNKPSLACIGEYLFHPQHIALQHGPIIHLSHLNVRPTLASLKFHHVFLVVNFLMFSFLSQAPPIDRLKTQFTKYFWLCILFEWSACMKAQRWL